RELAPQLGVEPLPALLEREQPLVHDAVGEDPPREFADRDELFGGGEVHGVRLWRRRAGQEGSGRNSGNTSSSSTLVNSTRTRRPIATSAASMPTRFETSRVPSSSSINAMAFGYENGGTGGWCATTKLYTCPRPLDTGES